MTDNEQYSKKGNLVISKQDIWYCSLHQTPDRSWPACSISAIRVRGRVTGHVVISDPWQDTQKLCFLLQEIGSHGVKMTILVNLDQNIFDVVGVVGIFPLSQ